MKFAVVVTRSWRSSIPAIRSPGRPLEASPLPPPQPATAKAATNTASAAHQLTSLVLGMPQLYISECAREATFGRSRGLPEGDLHPRGRRRARHHLGARRADAGGGPVGDRDDEEACIARPRRTRALPRRLAHAGREEGRARGYPPPSAARALPLRVTRGPHRRRPRRGGTARARALGRTRGNHRRTPRVPHPRPPRRPDSVG